MIKKNVWKYAPQKLNQKKQILQHRRKARKMSNTDPTKKLK
jgi:hypothetical protein